MIFGYLHIPFVKTQIRNLGRIRRFHLFTEPYLRIRTLMKNVQKYVNIK